jgi:PTH2 family peptidyl-tRNA hydrolase
MIDYKQCIIIREDLKLSKGKLATQAAHAAVSSVEKASKSTIENWKTGGQKKVVLKVPGLQDLYELKEIAEKKGIPTALISDAGHTQIPAGTVTALGIGPAKVEELDSFTGNLKLV